MAVPEREYAEGRWERLAGDREFPRLALVSAMVDKFANGNGAVLDLGFGAGAPGARRVQRNQEALPRGRHLFGGHPDRTGGGAAVRRVLGLGSREGPARRRESPGPIRRDRIQRGPLRAGGAASGRSHMRVPSADGRRVRLLRVGSPAEQDAPETPRRIRATPLRRRATHWLRQAVAGHSPEPTKRGHGPQDRPPTNSRLLLWLLGPRRCCG